MNRSVKLGPLFEHILILSATRKTPACAVSGMDERIPTLLGVSRVAAFGFKVSDRYTLINVFNMAVYFYNPGHIL